MVAGNLRAGGHTQLHTPLAHPVDFVANDAMPRDELLCEGEKGLQLHAQPRDKLGITGPQQRHVDYELA
jgi:hypothetical protein